MKADFIYCPIRKQHLIALPEEQIRIGIISHMVSTLGYPKSGLVIEKCLSKLPHLKNKSLNLPNRRIDILWYSKQGDSYLPLLLIECKAIPLNRQALQQIAGYNYHIGAPFMAVTNGKEIYHGYIDPLKQELKYMKFLPSYDELKLCINNFSSIRMNNLS